MIISRKPLAADNYVMLPFDLSQELSQRIRALFWSSYDGNP